MIRDIAACDAEAIADIYNAYIANTVITFEEEQVTAGEMESRIEKVTGRYPWYVWEEDGRLLGYAYADLWKSRCSFRHTVETSIYIREEAHGRGIGRAFYERLLPELGKRGVRAIVAGITIPNEKSIALHEHFGFEKVAHFREVGQKFGRWLDVGYWERLI